MKPTLRAWIFLALMSFAVIWLGHILGERQGLLWALAVALSINALVFFYAEFRLVPILSGKELEGTDPYGLRSITENLSAKLRIPTPRLFIMSSETPQALAVGNNWSQSRIYLTSGAIRRLNPDELRAIIAFELCAIQRLSTLNFSVSGAFVDAIMSLCAILDRGGKLIFGSRTQTNAIQNHIFSVICAPLVGLMAKFSVLPMDYFEIDRQAAELCGSPKHLAEALIKLNSYASTRPLNSPVFLSHFFIVNPLTKKGWPRYFEAHPKAGARVRKLVGQFPI